MSSAECDYQAVSAFEISYKKDDYTTKMEEGKKIRPFIAAILANLSSFAVGTTLGWTSPIQPKLDDPLLVDSPLSSVPTADDSAWIGSLLALGALIAPFAAGPMADKIGRKWTLLISTQFFVLAFVLLMLTTDVSQMWLARLIQGFGVGFVMTAQPMYVGEISTDDTRGALGSLMQLFIVAGILFVYAIGPYVSYYTLQYICVVVPLVFAACFYTMPESPYYYIGIGERDNAIKSLKFLRGKSEEGVTAELNDIQANVEESMQNKASFGDLFSSKGNLKALIISAGLISFQQLSGINVVLFYTSRIFGSTGSSLDASISTILVGIVQVVASGCTPLIVERLGKKLILICSAAGMCISMGALGLFFYIDLIDHEQAQGISWLPVVSLITYVIVYCLGFGPLPWAVLGEMFPSNVKSVASSLVASTCWVLGFLVTRFFSSIDAAVGSHWAFWIFAIFCGIAFVFTFTTVIETKGMSLQQIQDRLNGKKQ